MPRSIHIHPGRPSARLLLALGLALVALLALGAARAGATITSSHITTPTEKTFGLYEIRGLNAPVTVAGTTDSTEPSTDRVNIYCYGRGSVTKLASQVPLSANGGFSTEIAPEELFGTCRLRALPSEHPEPFDPTPFTGPLDVRAYVQNFELESGPNEGKTYNFRAYAPQLSAENLLDSIGSCGLSQSAVLNSAYEPTTEGFDCSDYFWKTADQENEARSRSEMQVDGANAYFADTAESIDEEASGLPGLTWSYRQNPANGNFKIEEVDPLVTCGSGAYPPTRQNCTAFVPTGVKDTRVIETSEEGELVTIADHYSSTDGQAHSLDMLNQQGLVLNPGPSAMSQLGFLFPGQTKYRTFGESGETVPLPSTAGPSVIYARQEYFPDGSEGTARAAIVYDRPSDLATCNYVYEIEAGFTLHQTATVPATGSTAFRYAYAQSYRQATVEALAAKAEAAFAAPVTPGGGNGPVVTPGQGTPTAPSTVPTVPANPGPPAHRGAPASGAIAIGHLRLDRSHGTATLTVTAPSAGHLLVAGPGVRTVRYRVEAAGPVLVTVRPTAALAATLRRQGHARVPLRVSFTPLGGSATTRTRSLTLARVGR